MQLKKVKEIKGSDFRKLQLLELDLLMEVDRICRKHKIKYTMIGGTMLGAVRHKGYIPWDDDADIGMLRRDYERFKSVSHELNPDLCFFQDHTTDPEYRWGYGKLRRVNTTYMRVGQEHVHCKTGVFIDIFPLDDIPDFIPLQIIQSGICYCCRKILWAEVGKYTDKNPFKRKWFSLLSNIPKNWVYKALSPMEKASRYNSPKKVRVLLVPAYPMLYQNPPLKDRYGIPKSWFKKLKYYDFEGQKLLGAKDYDGMLKCWFGDDYMTPPPENERIQHAPVSEYDFGSEEPIFYKGEYKGE